MNNATYTQLRNGSWGIRVAGTAGVGQTITVTKKDGSNKTETVQKVLWTGRDSKSGQTVSLCSIGAGKSGNSSGERGKCRHCGASLDRYALQHGYRYCSQECREQEQHGGQSYYDRNGNFVLGDED